MSDVFLSYSSDDRPKARQLAAALTQQGWDVWWDRTILPGKQFDKVIEEALSASTCVVVLWSERAVASQWVRAEAGQAMDKGQLIPAMLDETVIPLVFRQIQAASLSDWDGEPAHLGFQDLVRAISGFVAPKPVTDKTPTFSEQENPPPESVVRNDERDGIADAAVTNKPEPAQDTSSLAWYLAAGAGILILGLLGYIFNQEQPITSPPADIAGTEPVTEPIAATAQINQSSTPDTQAIPPSTAPSTALSTAPSTTPTVIVADRRPTARAITPPSPTPVKTTIKRVEPPSQVTQAIDPISPQPIQQALPEPPIATEPETPSTVLVVAWGTPSDEGTAGTRLIKEYSTRLANSMTEIIKD